MNGPANAASGPSSVTDTGATTISNPSVRSGPRNGAATTGNFSVTSDPNTAPNAGSSSAGTVTVSVPLSVPLPEAVPRSAPASTGAIRAAGVRVIPWAGGAASPAK